MKKIERGYPAHYCNAGKCYYHRNTLLVTNNNEYIIISTVGLQPEQGSVEWYDIGSDRIVETMVFNGYESEKEIIANTYKHLDFDCLSRTEYNSYSDADIMHERMVDKFTKKKL